MTELLDGRFSPWERSLEWESYVDFYCLALAKRGHTAVKYVPSIGVSMPTAYQHRFGHLVKRIPVYSPLLAPRALLRPRKYEGGLTTIFRPALGPAFTYHLYKEASKDNVAILHYSSYYSLFFIPSFAAARKFAVVTQYTGGALPTGRASRLLWQAMLARPLDSSKAVLIGNYASEREALTNVLKVDQKKQKLFDAPIIDSQLFMELDQAECRRKLEWDMDKKHILSVTFIPRRHSIELAKNPFLLVDVFAEALRMGLNQTMLHIVGWGPGEQDLKDYLREKGVADHVRVYGHIEHRKLPVYYSAADLVFLPYPLEKLNEGSVTIEAFACGRPVAAFKRHPTDSTEQLAGLLVDLEPKSGATTLMRYICQDDYLRAKGLEGKEFSGRFTLEFAGERLETVYKEAIG